MIDELSYAILAVGWSAVIYAIGYCRGRRSGFEAGADCERIRLVKVGALANHWLPGLPIVFPPAPHPRKGGAS